MLGRSRVFLKVHAGYVEGSDAAARDDWILVLRNLKSFWNVWIEIVLAVELGELSGDFPAYCQADANNALDSFFVRYWNSTWVRHTHRTDVCVRFLFVGVVLTAAKHFAVCLQFGVDFESDCCVVGVHGIVITILGISRRSPDAPHMFWRNESCRENRGGSRDSQ